MTAAYNIIWKTKRPLAIQIVEVNLKHEILQVLLAIQRYNEILRN